MTVLMERSMELGGYIFIGVYLLCALVLSIYAVNCYVMMYLFHRGQERQRQADDRACERNWAEQRAADWPVVTTQLPVYNEANVVTRLIDAVVAMEYPQGKHHIQVLDDSTDETSAIVARLVQAHREQGVWIEQIQRGTRAGYKAGALRHGMECGTGEYIAVFDADFVPENDFLKRMVPHIAEDKQCAAVQARWAYLNRRESVLTRAQEIGLDAHFAIEQGARAWNGLYMNFNGTAGIWRRAAIEAAGGWQDDTLTEDMDLSYRAQLAGWRLKFRCDVAVPCELPVTMSAYKSQQFRWAKGSLQTGRKLLPAILRSKDGLLRKFEAVMHLTHHVVDPLIMVLVLCAWPAVLVMRAYLHGMAAAAMMYAVFVISVSAPAALHMYGQRALGRRWWQAVPFIPIVSCVYTGLLVSNCRALYEAVRGLKTPFVRTPKRGAARGVIVRYRTARDRQEWIELLLGLYCSASLVYCVLHGHAVLSYFMILNSVAFIHVGLSSMMSGWRTRVCTVGE